MKISCALIFSLLFFANSFAQCPEDLYSFHTQAEVDAFPSLYPNCQYAHVLSFIGTDITDLAPLSYINQITHIQFHNTDNISSLLAFDNTTIQLSIYLKDCDGISSLDGIHLSNAESYTWLHLENNSLLENIDALNDLELFVKTVTIKDNPNLSACAVSRVCKSLQSDSTTIVIENNMEGCNSIEEVQVVCETMSVNSFDLERSIVLYPNPSSDKVFLSTPPDVAIEVLKVYSLFSQRISSTSNNMLDISDLSNGVYFVEISSNKGSILKKFIKY
jgi:hypothetical protein